MTTEWDHDDDEFDEDPWEDVNLPDGSSVSLPQENRFDFRELVDVIAAASGGAAAAFGPMVIESREYICSFGDIYFLRHEGDSGSENKMIGRFASEMSGVAACIAESEAFVADCSGRPCSAWTDESDVWDIEDRDVWDPDDEEEDDDEDWSSGFTPRCGGWAFSQANRYRVEPERAPLSSEEKQEAWERLCATTITHDGVVIAGNGASDVLPAAGVWHVIPCDEANAADLERVLFGCERSTVTVGGYSLSAVLTDGLAPMTAARVGAAFGADEIWELGHDTMSTISTDPPVVIAEALRVQ